MSVKTKVLLNPWAYILIVALSLASCKKDDPINLEDAQQIPRSVLTINQFIYDYMDLGYFWNADMPKINHRKEPDSEAYFYKLLKQPDDKWSFITDDVEALEKYFSGVTKSKGYSIELYRLTPNSNQVIAIVEFVYHNTPAEDAGLKRGDIIYRINGNFLTIENYQELLRLDNMVITLALIHQSGEATELSPSINISAVADLVHHPIVATSVIELGDKKVGYLAYTSFIANYDSELAGVFREFKTQGVSELVLDLRYNGGGSVSTALMLAEMIAPSSAVGEVFIREKWNNKLSSYNEDLKLKTNAQNLNLSRVFVLTTSATASASEMIIYGLKPHMEVIQIGETTHGKYYASVMLTDNNADPSKRQHNWAIQPIVLRSENKDNSINYQEGLPATFELQDNRYNAQLGEAEEHFLDIALTYIETGSFPVQETTKSASDNLRSIDGFKDKMDPLRNVMLTTFPEQR